MRNPEEPVAREIAGRSKVVALAIAAIEAPGSEGLAALGLDDQASVLGANCWVENRLFETLGTWVSDEPLPEACLLFDEHSQQHAWHSQLFWDRLPVLDRIDRMSLVSPPGKDVEWMFDQLSGAYGTELRLALLARLVLPRIIAGYTVHLRRAAPVADAPVIKSLKLVLGDDLEAWDRTEALFVRMGRPGPSAAATEEVESVEAQLAEVGTGLVPWPGSSDPAQIR